MSARRWDSVKARRFPMITAIKVFLAAAVCASSAAAIPDPPALLGQWPASSRGPAVSVVKVGSTLYAGLGSGGFSIYKVSTAQELELVGHLEVWHACNDVQVVGNVAYLALATSGLGIVDVTDPAHPKLLSTIDTPGMALNVALVANTAYVADWTGGLQIIDVADSANPKILGAYTGASTVWEVTVRNGLAYASAGSLDIVDVSNPTNTVRLGRYRVGTSQVFHTALKDSFAFAAGQGQRLAVLDISDPANIKPVTTYAYTNVTSLSIESSRLFVTGHGWGTLFASVDITDPANPVELGRIAEITGSGRMDIDGEVAWLPSEYAGIRAINLSNPPSLNVINTTETAGESSEIVVRGDRAFVADGSAGLQVLDVRDPAAIKPVSRYVSTNGPISAVRVTNSLAAIIAGPSVEFLDVSDPSRISVVSQGVRPTLYDWPATVELTDRRAYVAGYGLWMVNLDDPTKPITTSMVASTLMNRIQFSGLCRRGSTLFATTSGAIMAYDISDTDNPRLVGQHTPPGIDGASWRYGPFQIHGDIGFAPAYYMGVEAIDFRDPAHPMTLGNSILWLGFGPLVGYGNYSFGAAGNWTMFDIENPSDVKFLHKDIAPPAGLVTISGDRGYLPLGARGIAIYQMPMVAPVIVEQPKGGVLSAGESITLRVAASGGAPMSFQWVRNGHPIGGATNSALTVRFSEAGTYTVNVSNAAGSVASKAATVGQRHEVRFEQIAWTPVKPLSVEISGNSAYVVAGSVYIFDVSDPRNMTLSWIFNRADARAVRWSNGLMYVADGASLSIWDFQYSPYLPIGRIGFQTATTDVFIIGSKAVVALGQPGLRHGVAVVDVSNPRAPSLVKIWDGTFQPMKVAGNNSRVVGCASYEGFRSFDPLNSSVLAGSYVTEGVVSNAVVLGRLAVTALDEYPAWGNLLPPSIQIFDVSEPKRPASIGRIPTVTTAAAIGGDGRFVYAGFEGAIKAFDLAEPTRPEAIGSYSADIHPYFIKAANPYLYVCDSVHGMLVLKMSPTGDVPMQSQIREDGTIALSWPGAFGGVVQKTSSLDTPAWTDIPSSGEELQITPNGGNGFYRLKLP